MKKKFVTKRFNILRKIYIFLTKSDLGVLNAYVRGQVCKSDIYSGLYVLQTGRSSRLQVHGPADPSSDVDVFHFCFFYPLVILEYTRFNKFRVKELF